MNATATVGPVAPTVPERPATSGRPRALATVALLVATGLLVQALGYADGWAGSEARALVLFFVGLVLVVAPSAWLLLAPGLTARQRWVGALLHALAMYASWLLTDPVMATRFDETLHVLTLEQLLDGDGFFAVNAMLPVSPHYPGLELATTALVWLTGWPLMVCQVTVVVVSRVVLVTALFTVASRVARSSRVGGAAVLLYSGSAQFYFFNAQFSYQTVAIALAVTAMVLLARALDAERPWRTMLVLQVVLAALDLTHHLTSWLTIAALWAVALLLHLGRERRRARTALIAAEIATIVCSGWTAVIAPLLVSYLGPVFDTAGSEVAALVAMDGGGREVLADTGGDPTPLWEVVVMAGSMALWCLLLLPSCWAMLHGRTPVRSRSRLLVLGLAASYPLLQLLRFYPTAADVGDRASTFVALAMAVVVALWLVPRLTTPARTVTAATAALVIVVGGVLLGSGPDWQRVPGGYLAGAEQRSVDGETVAVARWAGRYLPDGSRIVSDTTMDRVLPNFAPVVPVLKSAGDPTMTPLFLDDAVSDADIALLKQARVDFLVVDTRLIGHTARSGSFFEAGSAFGPEAQTMTAPQLEKFRGEPGFDLVLDGPVQVYDVRGLTGEPRDFVDRGDPGLPGARHVGWQSFVALGLLVTALVLRRGRIAPRRWRPRLSVPGALALPTAMLVGGVGVATGLAPGVGIGVLAALLGGALLATREPVAGPDEAVVPRDRVPGLLGALAAAVVALALAIAAPAAYHALLDTPIPAEPTTTTVLHLNAGDESGR